MWWFDSFSHWGFHSRDYHTHARGTHAAARETPTVVASTSRKKFSPGGVPAKGAKGTYLGGRGAKRTDDQSVRDQPICSSPQSPSVIVAILTNSIIHSCKCDLTKYAVIIFTIEVSPWQGGLKDIKKGSG